jgi:hypothetical protein
MLIVNIKNLLNIIGIRIYDPFNYTYKKISWIEYNQKMQIGI